MEIRKEYKTNVITRGLFEKLFSQIYRSVVVLSNPKTVLNDKNAPQDVRDVVIRADQLVSHIKKIEKSDKDLYKCDEKEMRELMDTFVKCVNPVKSDYAKKYEELLAEQDNVSLINKTAEVVVKVADEGRMCPKCGQHFWGCSGFPKCWYNEK